MNLATLPLKRFAALLMLVLATAAWARQAPATVRGPTLGYVWDRTGPALRPVHGILGNALVGNRIDMDLRWSSVVALDGFRFLASSDASPGLFLVNLEITHSVVSIADAPANPSRVGGSRLGTAAAAYYADEGRVRIIAGLPAHPFVGHILELAHAGSSPSTIAVSDDGGLLLYSIPEGGLHSIYRWTPESGTRLVTTSGQVSSMALAPSGDVVVADSETDEVFFIADPRGTAVRHFLADGTTGVTAPQAVAVSDANQIIVSNGDSQSILTFDFSGRLLRVERCGCRISGLYRLRDSIYNLSDNATQTMFLLESSPVQDHIVFAPTLPEHQ